MSRRKKIPRSKKTEATKPKRPSKYAAKVLRRRQQCLKLGIYKDVPYPVLNSTE